MAKLSDLHPPPPAIRYQREHPGDLLHIDIKKLGRIVRPGHRVTGNKRDHFPGAGWEFVHVAIDDASRMAYAKIMPDEKIASVTEFLREWAYAAVYQNSAHRQQHLQPWLHRYNWHRPHSALKLKTPVQSLNLTMNNVLRLHT